MSDARKFCQGLDYFLDGSGITLSATTIVLTSMTFPDGTNITTTDIGALAYAVIEPGVLGQEENISFTGITQNATNATLTGVTRGLKFKDPYDQDLALRVAHAGGTTLRISNTAPFYADFPNKDNDETISGLWQFPNDANTPILGNSYVAPTLDTQVPSKKYVDTVAIQGAPDAGTTTKGITKISVAAVSPTNPIAVGDNDPRIPTSGQALALAGDSGTPGSANTYVTQAGLQKSAEIYGASSTGNDTYVIALSPVLAAYADGQTFWFKVDVGNTGGASLNAGPGAKTLVKGISTALGTGDIIAGSVYGCKYSLANDNLSIFTPLGGGSLSISSFASKGDIISASGASTPSTLTVGANRTVLGANSATTTGLEWRDSITTGFGVTSYDTSTASGTQNIAHGMGIAPTFAEFTVLLGTSGNGFSQGASDGTNGANIHSTATIGGVNDSSNCILIATTAGNQQAATATFDATNIVLHWVKNGGPTGTATIFWRAYAK